MKTVFPAACVCFFLGLTLACGGKTDTANANPGIGTVKVSLVPQTSLEVQSVSSEINLQVLAVEIKGQGDWIRLGEPNSIYDLQIELRSPWSYELIPSAVLPAGHYSRMRLIPGTANSGADSPLQLPPGFEKEIAFDVDLDVAKDAVSDVCVVIDPGLKSDGTSMLHPACQAVDRNLTGTVSGVLGGSTPTDSWNLMVYAETLDAQGVPHIVRRCRAEKDGSYILDLLPLGANLHVVSMYYWGSGLNHITKPVVSDAIALPATPASKASFDSDFTSLFSFGAISGDILPVAGANQSDSVVLMTEAPLPSGGTGTFTVDLGEVLFSGGREFYKSLQNYVPSGTYKVQAIRTTWNADGTTTVTPSAIQSVFIPADGTASPAVNFDF